MNQRANAIRIALSILVSVSAAACAVSTEERADSRSEALARGGVDSVDPIATIHLPPPPPPPPPAQFPPANPIYCPTVSPTCSVKPLSWYDPRSVDLHALGCSGEQYWLSGYASGLIGGIFALCPNTAAVREKYGQFYQSALACSACIPQAPAGEIYVLIEGFVGPNCESGCLTNPVGKVQQVDDGTGLNN